MLDAERARVLEVRDQGQVASEVVSEVLAMLDVEESMIDVAQASRDELKTEYSRVRRTGASCDHLEDHPVQAVEQEPSPVCQACLDDGHDLGVAAALPGVRQHRLLRLLGDAARHRRTSARPRTRSCSRPSRWRTGAGASCTTSRPEPRRRHDQAGGRSSAGGSVGAVGSAGSADSGGAGGTAGTGGSAGAGGTGGAAGVGGTGGTGGGGGGGGARQGRIRRRRRDRRGLRHGGGGGGGGGGAVTSRNGGSLPACSIPQMPETSR